MSETRSELAAQRVSKIAAIVVDHPRQVEAHGRLELMCSYGRRGTVGGQFCLPIIAQSFSGKSTILATFAARKNLPGEMENGRIAVLHVTLHPKSTSKQLATDILLKIQDLTGSDTQPHRGTEHEMYRRVLRFVSMLRVELLILDEFQHVVNSNSKSVIWNVGETVKSLLLEGTCPIVISGVREAGLPFKGNVQLRNRAVGPVDLNPFRFDNPSHLELFSDFIAGMIAQMEAAKVVSNASMLIDHVAALLEASEGIIGLASRFIQMAVERATVLGRDDLQVSDLIAVADEFVALNHHDRNPFVEGLATLRGKEAA